MKFGIFALCCLVATAAAVRYDAGIKVPMTVNQEFINTMLRHISQPIIFEEYRQFVDKPVLEPKRYVSLDIYQTRIYRFFEMYEHGLVLPRGRVGTFFDQKFSEQTGLLFNMFYYSIDLPTLFQNIIWARENVNELMFVHALHMTIFHRADIKDIVLPPLYEILPSHFFTYDVLQKGYDYKMAGLDKLNSTFTVYTDYTSRFYLDKFEEQRLAYFTEDIGLNSFYYYFYMRYPFFFGGRFNSVDMKVFGFDKEPVGEMYFYMHQQLLARYYLERLSNDMGEIETINWVKGIKTGYWPMLRYKNGLEFSYRSDFLAAEGMDKDLYNDVFNFEYRIRDMIDSGYITIGDKKYYINDPHFMDILGNLVLGNVEESRFYRYVMVFYHLLAGGHNAVKMDSYYYAPSVLEHFETVLRDPVFYQLYKRIVSYYFQAKYQLPTYTTEDLYVPVKIDDVVVSPLKTYFEYEQVDATNFVDMDIVEPKFDYKFLIRQPRLNYEPFDVKVFLNAEMAGDYTFRFFLGPSVLNRYNLNEVRESFFELDHFIAPLQTGKNTITRQSREFLYFFRDLIKLTQEGGQIDYDTVNKYLIEYGFPARLLLPKGKVGGMPFTFYVIVHKNDGKQALGFPFDRKVDVLNFFVPNMFFKDVLIFQHVDYDIYSPKPLNNIFYNDVIPMHSIRVPFSVDYFKDNELDTYFWHFNDVYRVWYKKYFPTYYKPSFLKEYKPFTYTKDMPFTYPTIYKKDFPFIYNKDMPMSFPKDMPITYQKEMPIYQKDMPIVYQKEFPTTFGKTFFRDFEPTTTFDKTYTYPLEQKEYLPTTYTKPYTTKYEKEYTPYPYTYPIHTTKYEKEYPEEIETVQEPVKPFRYGRFDFINRFKNIVKPTETGYQY